MEIFLFIIYMDNTHANNKNQAKKIPALIQQTDKVIINDIIPSVHLPL